MTKKLRSGKYHGFNGTRLLAAATVALAYSAISRAADAPIGHVVTAQGGALIRSERPGGKPLRVAKPGDEVFVGDTVNTASSGSVKLLLMDKTIIDIGASALFNVKKVEGGGPGRKIEVGLPYGTARAAVAKPLGAGGEFKVRSSAATMGVRGTEFVIQSPLENPSQVSARPQGASSSAGAKTTVTVLQGLVAVQSNSTAPQSSSGEASSRAPASGGGAPVMLSAGTQLSTVLNPTAGSSVEAPGERGPASAGGPVKVDSQTLTSLSSSSRIVDTTFRDAITLDLSGPSSSSGSASNGGSDGGGGNTQSSEKGESSASGSTLANSGEGSDGASSAPTASGDSTGGGASNAAPGVDGGGLANFTASLILDTVVAPPPSIAEVSAPQAVVQSVAQASFTGGASVENTVAAAQNIAPLTAGGTRKLTVIIAP